MFTLKYPEKINELQFIKPNLMLVLGHFCQFAVDRNLPVTITNILGDFGSSKTHSQGRAIDISVIGWDMNQIAECLCYVRSNVGHLGAVSAETGLPNVILYHKFGDGAFHYHLQVKA